MNDKPLYPLSVGQEAAELAIEMIKPVCRQVAIAGSVRRKRPQVRDVDLVIWPEYEVVVVQQQLSLFITEHRPSYQATGLLHLARKLGWDAWDANTWPGIVRIPTSEESSLAVERIPIELYICEPDGSNFDALWQMRTGSAEYNIRLAKRAQELGLKYRAGYGIFEGERRMDDGTERGIWTALRWEFVPPESRG
jgi:DNA polymerase/3'-5' exonuclease PolX